MDDAMETVNKFTAARCRFGWMYLIFGVVDQSCVRCSRLYCDCCWGIRVLWALLQFIMFESALPVSVCFCLSTLMSYYSTSRFVFFDRLYIVIKMLCSYEYKQLTGWIVLISRPTCSFYLVSGVLSVPIILLNSSVTTDSVSRLYITRAFRQNTSSITANNTVHVY